MLLFAQAVAELGWLKLIGAVIIVVLFAYGMFGVKHNRGDSKDKGNSSNSSSSSSSSDTPKE